MGCGGAEVRVEMVSLVVATRWRTLELKRLLGSLLAQTYKTFEVIVADQNEDDRLAPLLQDYCERLTIKHVRSANLGHSAGSNAGLRICAGDIVGFPDDDCWYAPDLLRRVVDMFEAHPEWRGITGCEASAENAVNKHRFDQVAGPVTRQNIWRRHISFAAFFRTADLTGLFYDERLGIGAETIWGSGEETDFLLQFIKRGCVVQYDPSVAVYHPDWGRGPYTMAALTKARRYGMGMGRILQTHRFPALVTLKYFARPLLGGAYTLICGKPRKAVYHWAIFLGRTTGWMVSLISNQVEVRSGTPWLSAK
jgi:glycosyltransferase involved in cell wall biosynthesis